MCSNITSHYDKVCVVHLSAQNNCFLDEAAATKLSLSFGHDPPPLLELSARTVYQFKLFPPLNTIPLHLSREFICVFKC